MLRDRTLQIKVAKDEPTTGTPSQPIDIDEILVTAGVVVGAVIVVTRLSGLFCKIAEHVVVTKIN